MAKLLSLFDRHNLGASLHDALRYTFNAAFAKDNSYTLFRYEDWPAWVLFTSVFLCLIAFDNLILNRNPAALTMQRAVYYTLFWVVCAGGFCGWVAWWYSPASAYMWWSGYMLEWMLSFDNLFVFHLVFQSYACPENLKHRPLFFGILGAVIMRLIFIFAGQYLMHAMGFMHLVFGAFLIYTGIQAVLSGEDDEDDPSQQCVVVWLQNHMKFVNVYGSKGEFFVRCPINEDGEPDIPEDAIVKNEQEPSETTALIENGEEAATSKHVDVVDFSRIACRQQRTETRATMLFLVCFCLNLCDLLFAVDSVSAIVAAVNDLFLAYTSAVFAMLGMRAIFFLINKLVQMFSLLKYGVSFILVFIGVKLIVGKFYHIPSSVVCTILVAALGFSMLASVIQGKIEEKYEIHVMSAMSPESKDRIAKSALYRKSPCASPMAPNAKCGM